VIDEREVHSMVIGRLKSALSNWYSRPDWRKDQHIKLWILFLRLQKWIRNSIVYPRKL